MVAGFLSFKLVLSPVVVAGGGNRVIKSTYMYFFIITWWKCDGRRCGLGAAVRGLGRSLAKMFNFLFEGSLFQLYFAYLSGQRAI